MKLFGTAFFSLALFTLCHDGSASSLAAATVSSSTVNPSSVTPANSAVSHSKGTIPAHRTSSVSSKATARTSAGDAKGTPSPANSANSTLPSTQGTPTSLTANGTIGRNGTESTPKPVSKGSLAVHPTNSQSELTPTYISISTSKASTALQNNGSKNEVQSNTQETPQGTQNIADGAQNATEQKVQDSSSSFVLPLVIALTGMTLCIFPSVVVYKMCRKTTPERQENGTEQAPSDKENVKLISVKTTSPETGEHTFQGKNKTRHDDSSLRLGNKCV
ncbi:endomucin isoform X2 [Hemicordylus capensis]|uniref:endomucin isoform X2 n=1 Tax=Hemicordylus capensis TaxID=884348 RepID=UPI002304D0B9|nr:endomucin isoform X2 [Hemicordylus capensis]